MSHKLFHCRLPVSGPPERRYLCHCINVVLVYPRGQFFLGWRHWRSRSLLDGFLRAKLAIDPTITSINQHQELARPVIRS
jgi:hypothetical protein